MSSILDLEALVAGLPPAVAAAAARIFAITASTASLEAPEEMEDWIVRTFGSLDAVRTQRIVRVTNLVTLEGALFNELRSRRPKDMSGVDDVRKAIAGSANDPFCHVGTGTPRDIFGHVRGRLGTAVSNVAKYDGWHGVLVFDEHDPLAPMSAETLRDHFRTAHRWADKAIAADPGARYYFLLWNALWRAGGSLVHGHMQMTLTRGMHYPKVEALRRQALRYRSEQGSDYFDDLWSVHDALGLGTTVGGARILAYLAPVKEQEMIVLGDPGGDEMTLAAGISHALATLRRDGVTAHNLALYLPPLSDDGTDWSRFPPLARLVSRGEAGDRTSDIGAMELYAASVVATDPFRIGSALRG